MGVVETFKEKWLNKSGEYINNPAKTRTLLESVTKMFSKDGLKDVLEDLKSIVSYVRDITNGSYKEYSATKLAFAIAVIIYVVSPLDLIPDFMPGGLVDDAALIPWAVKQLQDELRKYRYWKS